MATYQVTATVKDSKRETIGVYIIGTPTLTVGHPGDPDGIGGDAESGSKGNPGLINDTLPTKVSPMNRAFTAIVKDGATLPNNVPGVVVTFRASGSETGGGRLVFNSTNNVGILVDSSNRKRFAADGITQLPMDTAKILYVRTDDDGQADVDFQLGTDRKQDVTISAVGQSKVVSAYSGAAFSGKQLVNPSSQSSRAADRAGEYELRVKAEDEDGRELSQYHVEFRTSDGTLDNPSDDTAATDGGRLPVQTDTQGIAFVFFDPTDSSDSLRVTAHLLDTDPTESAPMITDNIIDDVVFNVGGGGRDVPRPPVARLTISVTGTGATRSVTVNALNAAGNNLQIAIPVTLSGTALTFSRTLTTGTALTIPLPTIPRLYTLVATDPSGTFALGTINITVAAAPTPGNLSITAIGAVTNLQQTVEVSATSTAGTGVQGVSVTLTGAFFTTQTVTTLAGGTVRAIVTIPSATGQHTLTVSARDILQLRSH